MEPKHFRVLLRRALILPLLVMAVLAGVLLWESYDLRGSMEWVDHTDQVISASRRAYQLMLDEETGVRGYLLTGDPQFLQPYNEARKTFETQFQAWYRLVQDNPQQQLRLQRLHELHAQWQGYAASLIGARHRGNASSSPEENLEGKYRMDGLRSLLAEFQQEEENLRNQRSRRAQARWHLVATSCIVLALGFAAVIALFTRSQMRTLAASFQGALQDATQRAREIAESEQRWVTTLTSIGDAVLATDAEGRLTFLNPLAESLLECTCAECRGRLVDDCFKIEHEVTGADIENPVAKVLRQHQIVELENHTVLTGAKGRRTPIADSAAPIRGASGGIIGVVLVFRDVTERRKREHERAMALLREQSARQMAEQTAEHLRKIESVTEAALAHLSLEELLREMLKRTARALDADMAVLLLLNPKSQMLEVRAALGLEQELREQIHIPFGFGVAGTIAKTGQLRIIENLEDEYAFSPYLREQVTSLMGAPLVVENRIIGVIHVDSKTRRKFAPAEAALLQVVADRVALAIDHRQAEDAVLKSKNLLETFIAEAPVGLAMFDRNMRYLQVSQRWLEDTGLGLHDILGKSHYELFPNLPEPWKEAHRRGMSGESLKAEDDWVTAIGETRSIRWEIHPWGDSGTTTGGIVIFMEDITERRQAERALVESEAQFRNLANAMPQLCWMANPDGWIFWYNERWYQYTGMKPEQMQGWGWQSVHHPDTLPAVVEKWKASLDAAAPFEMIFPLRGADGVFHPFLSRAVPLKDGSGKVVRWFGTNTDITEQRRIEAALLAERQVLETIVNHLPAAVLLIDAKDLRIQLANPAYSVIAPGKDVVGKTIPEVWPEVGPRLPEIFQRVLATGEPHTSVDELIYIRRSPDGPLEPGYFTWSVFRVRMPGTGEWGFLNTTWETTQRKRVEDALRESQARWAITLQSIGDAVISTDATGKVVFMNDVAQRLTGWSLAEAEGRELSAVFDIVQEVTRIRPEHPVARVLRSGEVVGLANHTALIRRDGSEIPIEDSGAPIRNSNGELEGVVLVFHDVSEQRRAEKVLRNSERLATTGKLAATLAHEIHNPLDSVSNLLFLIQQRLQDETALKYTSMAVDELGRVAQMTQQMLTFQRDSAKPVLVKICEVLETVLALYRRKVDAAGIKVEQRIECDDSILAQPGEIRQVFANLVGNAIEALEPQGRLTLRVKAARNWRTGRRGLRIVIADNGRGIPPEIREKIFEPFFTTKGESGTGLGLWITLGIISKYDGTLRLRSSTRPESAGTSFSVFLPVQEQGQGPEPKAE